MNFLQLCQETALDSGTIAGVPNITTVAGATGRVRQLVGWVRDAYIDIQNERLDWLWMNREFSAALTADKSSYLASELGIDNVAEWIKDIPTDCQRNMTLYETGQKEREDAIRQIPYMEFRDRYSIGVHETGQPVEWAVDPQNKLLLGPTPDKAYVIAGRYRQTPQELALDDDVPEMPARFHRLIIGEAMRLMARSDEAFQVLIEKSQQYERLRSPLVNDQTPDMVIQ